jgi:predicted transcriptional regulator
MTAKTVLLCRYDRPTSVLTSWFNCVKLKLKSNVIKPGGDLVEDHKLGVMESKFADLIWDNAPIPSGDLVKLCEKALTWKKSTTYTMLRRLCERGIFKNSDGTVTSLMSKQEFTALQSERFVEETFDGSLPQFLAAFTLRKKLSESEISELQRLIDEKGGKP